MKPVILALALALAAPAAAETRAVLVGVGDYAWLDADLKGPPNDVRLMAEALIARGVPAAAITVLTTAPAGLPQDVATGSPTRAAILAALDGLAAAGAPGDTAVFYFSGHGSQAPDQSGDEQGGQDEIFLPADAKGWNGATGLVENAILDDELQAKAAAILARGQRLVGLIDACHSATGFRAPGGAGVARALPPEALGIPADAPSALPGPPNPPLSGAFVFLYSSQSDQRSFEYPQGAADGPADWYGEFTRQLARVLREVPDASWAQALAAVQAQMRQGSAQQTPDGEGPMLSAALFGNGGGAGRFRIVGGRLRAGLLDGLTAGSEIAIYAGPAGGPVLARARLLAPTAAETGLAALGGALPQTGWAELALPAPPPPLRLAPLAGGDAALAADLAQAAAAAGAEIVTAGAELFPVAIAGGIALAGSDGVLDPSGPGSSPRAVPRPGETMAAALDRSLADAARALRLRRALAAAAEAARGGLSLGTDAVGMTVERRPGRRGPDGACTGSGAPAEPGFDPARGVADCDALWLTLANRSARAQDVTVFYIDRDFGLSVLYPRGALSNRLALGERLRTGLRIEVPPGAAGGVEEILVAAVAADPQDPRSDLSGLADPAGARGTATGAPTALWLAAALGPADVRPRDFAALTLSPFTVIRRTVRLSGPPS